MTRSREDTPFEKVDPEAISVRFMGRDKEKLTLLARSKGLSKSAQVRMWCLKAMAEEWHDGGFADNLNSSDFSPLGG
jgi:hypothetical protein